MGEKLTEIIPFENHKLRRGRNWSKRSVWSIIFLASKIKEIKSDPFRHIVDILQWRDMGWWVSICSSKKFQMVILRQMNGFRRSEWFHDSVNQTKDRLHRFETKKELNTELISVEWIYLSVVKKRSEHNRCWYHCCVNFEIQLDENLDRFTIVNRENLTRRNSYPRTK